MAVSWGWDDVNGLLTLAGMALTAGGFAVAHGMNKAKINENSARITQLEQQREKEQAEHARIEREFAEFRERIAREFVAREHMRDLEERFLVAIDRLSKQMDTLTDRLDRVLMKSTPRG
jgi:outer membrane murein-binding lipoprotein Lpp